MNNIFSSKVNKVKKQLPVVNKKHIFVFASAFTLVEILVAISIFTLTATMASSIFSTFAHNQKKIKVSQELLNNTQYVLETISREVKNNEIISFGADRCQGLPVNYTQCLLFTRENGETNGFVYSGSEISYVQLNCDVNDRGIYSNCVLDDTQEPIVMLSAAYNNVNVLSLDFLLTPDTNPYFDSSGTNNQQPKVTIKMEVSYAGAQIFEQVNYRIQTTVSSRIYKR